MSSSIYSIQDATKLNNQAISLIAIGEYSPAIAMLTKALHLSQQGLTSSDPHPSLMSESFNLILDECMCHGGIREDDSKGNAVCDKELQFLYAKPIQMPTDLCEFHYTASVTASVIVIFNLALTHQLCAIECTTNPKNRWEDSASRRSSNKMALSYFRKAANLYELAHRLQEEEELQSTTFFVMAILNNMGLIHQVLNQTSVADQFFQDLLSTLMYVIDGQYYSCPKEEVWLGSSDVDGFLRNTMHLVSKKGRTAAAA